MRNFTSENVPLFKHRPFTLRFEADKSAFALHCEIIQEFSVEKFACGFSAPRLFFFFFLISKLTNSALISRAGFLPAP